MEELYWMISFVITEVNHCNKRDHKIIGMD